MATKGIAISAQVHADLSALAKDREVGVGALAEEILAAGVARKRADSARHKGRAVKKCQPPTTPSDESGVGDDCDEGRFEREG